MKKLDRYKWKNLIFTKNAHYSFRRVGDLFTGSFVVSKIERPPKVTMQSAVFVKKNAGVIHFIQKIVEQQEYAPAIESKMLFLVRE